MAVIFTLIYGFSVDEMVTGRIAGLRGGEGACVGVAATNRPWTCTFAADNHFGSARDALSARVSAVMMESSRKRPSSPVEDGPALKKRALVSATDSPTAHANGATTPDPEASEDINLEVSAAALVYERSALNMPCRVSAKRQSTDACATTRENTSATSDE